MNHPDERVLGLHLLQFGEVGHKLSMILTMPQYSLLQSGVDINNTFLIVTLQTVEEACSNLLPNVLCEYLYNMSENFTRFYSNCQVLLHLLPLSCFQIAGHELLLVSSIHAMCLFRLFTGCVRLVFKFAKNLSP